MDASPEKEKKGKKKAKKKEDRSRSLDISEEKEKKRGKRPKSEALDERSASSRATQTDRSSILKRKSKEQDQESGKSPEKFLVEGPLLTDSVLQNLDPKSGSDDLTSGKTESSDVVSSDADQSGAGKKKKKKRKPDKSPQTESFDEIGDDGRAGSSRASQKYQRSHSKDRGGKRDLLGDRSESSIATQTYRRSTSKDKSDGRSDSNIATQTYYRPSSKKASKTDDRADSSRATQTYRKPVTSPSKKKKKKKDKKDASSTDNADQSGVDEPSGAELGSKTDPYLYNKGPTPEGPDELVPYRPDPMTSSELKRSSSAHVPFIEVTADKKRKKQRPAETPPTTDDQTPSSMSQRRDLKPSDSNEALILDQDDVPQPYDDQGATSLEDTTPRTTLDKSGAQLGTSADETEDEDGSDIEGSEPQEASPEENAAKGSKQQPPDFLASAPQLAVDDEPTSGDEKEPPSGKETEEKEDPEKRDGRKSSQLSSPSKRSASGRKGKRVQKKLTENQRFMDKSVLVCSTILLVIMFIYVIVFAFLRSKDHLLLYFAIVNMPRNALTLHALFVMLIVTGTFPAVLAIIGTVKKNELVMRMYLTLAIIFAIAYTFSALAWAGVLYSWSESFQDRMFVTLTRGYHGELAQNLESVAWNFIQYKYSRCGVTSYHEWKSSSWYKSFKFNGDAEDLFIEDYRAHNMGIKTKRPWPLFCCKGIHEEVKVDEIVDRRLTEDSFSDEFINTCYTVDGKPWSEDEYTDTSNSNETGPYRFVGKTHDRGALNAVTEVFFTLFVATAFSALAVIILYIVCIIFVATLLRKPAYF